MAEKKVYCNTCKYCSDVKESKRVGCNANCEFKERLAYVRYVKKQEREMAKINPVTGKKNGECPSESDIYYPDKYISCSDKNKLFNCKDYEKTDKIIYLNEFKCPYDHEVLEIYEHNYANSGAYKMECPKCLSRIELNIAGKPIEFEVEEETIPWWKFW